MIKGHLGKSKGKTIHLPIYLWDLEGGGRPVCFIRISRCNIFINLNMLIADLPIYE